LIIMFYFAPVVKGLTRGSVKFNRRMILNRNVRLKSWCCSTFHMCKPLPDSENTVHTTLRPSRSYWTERWVSQPSRRIHTQGENELSRYLRTEIQTEEERIKREPYIDDYVCNIHGTHATLSRTLLGEKIEITFDVNKSETLERDIDDSSGDGELVSYPEINVSIKKKSGTTLLFNITCEIKDEEDAEEFHSEEVDDELITINNVQVYNANENKIYETDCSKETMEEELYSMLLHH